MRQGKVLDLAFSEIDAAWVERRVAEGVEMIVQDIWTGGYANNDRLREVAANNLRAIRHGRARPAVYSNASVWRTPQLWFDESQRNAGSELQYAELVMVDLEIADGDKYIDPDAVWAFIDLWEPARFPAWTYSADWYAGLWKLRLGDASRVNFNKPYVHARYDGIPDLVVNPPRHPLGPLAGKQYAGSLEIEGVSVDLNVWDMDLLRREPDEMAGYDQAIIDAAISLKDAEYVTDGYAIYYVERKGDVPVLKRVDDSIAGIIEHARTVPLGVSMLFFHGEQIA